MLDRATIYFSGMFGMQVREVKELVIEIRPCAQYPAAIHIEYVEKGKRKRVGRVFDHDPSLVVLDGWSHSLTPRDPMTAPDAAGVRETRHASFAPAYATEFGEQLERFTAEYPELKVHDYRKHQTGHEPINNHGLTLTQLESPCQG